MLLYAPTPSSVVTIDAGMVGVVLMVCTAPVLAHPDPEIVGPVGDQLMVQDGLDPDVPVAPEVKFHVRVAGL